MMPQRMSVVIDGEQYYSLKELQQIAPMMKPSPVVVDGGERSLLEASLRSLSDTNWTVGQMAAQWIKKFARSRTDADFGSLVGLSPDQVFQRRRVWETFADVRQNYPRLFWSHFYAAMDWNDADECLQWAQDVQAGVAEMRAWRRAQHGEDLSYPE